MGARERYCAYASAAIQSLIVTRGITRFFDEHGTWTQAYTELQDDAADLASRMLYSENEGGLCDEIDEQDGRPTNTPRAEAVDRGKP